MNRYKRVCAECGQISDRQETAFCLGCGAQMPRDTADQTSSTSMRGGDLHMYCRNCGQHVAEQAVMCVTCGVPPRNGTKFCQNCGSETNPAAEICIKCGVRLAVGRSQDISSKSRLTTTLLAFFLGCFGIHRFYLGQVGLGILMLLTFGGCGIWAFIDFIIAACGSMRDKDGKTVADWETG